MDRTVRSREFLASGPSLPFPDTKRVLDVLLASILIILTLPLLLMAMLAIVLSTGGPVLFRQRRIGLQRREFVILKLRTMRSGRAPAPHGNRVFNKIQGDARITSVGRILRRFSVDELPQLFNVLRGEMSIVGPRPLLLSDMEQFPRGGPMRRFEVKPGLTGLWQVSGRSLLSDQERIRLDLEYVERWSTWLDIKILLRTPLAVVRGKGAF